MKYISNWLEIRDFLVSLIDRKIPITPILFFHESRKNLDSQIIPHCEHIITSCSGTFRYDGIARFILIGTKEGNFYYWKSNSQSFLSQDEFALCYGKGAKKIRWLYVVEDKTQAPR